MSPMFARTLLSPLPPVGEGGPTGPGEGYSQIESATPFTTSPSPAAVAAPSPTSGRGESKGQWCFACFCLLVGWACTAQAQQYRSEQRELKTPPPPAQQRSAEQQLQSVTDPYAKALLLRELAAEAASRKDYSLAAKRIEQALALNALSGVAADQLRQTLAQWLMSSGDFSKNLPQLEAQVRAGNATPEILVALGAAYTQARRYKEAVPLLQRGIRASKTPDPSWKRALLSALLGAGQTEEALPLLEQAVRDTPRDRDVWAWLCAAMLQKGDRARALAYLQMAARLGFLDAEADRLRLVQLTGQLGAPFAAASALQRWLEARQIAQSPATLKLLASLWIAAKEQGPALAALDRAIAASPSAELYQSKAAILLRREQYAAAIQSQERAIAMGARNGPMLLQLAMARYQQADVDGAVAAFDQARQFPQTKKSAEDWLRYLGNQSAREQAMLAMQERATRVRDETVALAGGVPVGSIDVTGSDAVPAVAAAPGDAARFTPIGAEQNANADGRIPAWTGGLGDGDIPATYKPGGKLADPYAGDRPLFTITAANAAQYAAQLSRGHRALLTKYKSYAMPVYATHRSARYPQAIYDATQANLGKARLLGSDSLSGARLGFPFPQPKTGVEILWNHRVRYRGDTLEATYKQAAVQANGSITARNEQTFRASFRYGSLRDPVDIGARNILLYGITYVSESGRSPEYVVLFHEPADTRKAERNLWVLATRLKKMLRIPPVGYDQPFPGTEALEFIDMVDMYNGAFDRYDWKLIGKREMFIPYNAYRLSDGSRGNAQLLKPGHLDSSATRYELHRVWVVEASERGGKRHAFGQRTFYVDEDSWNVVLVENEDHDGNLWRFQEGHLTSLYDIKAVTAAPTVTYDLKDGRYFANRLLAESKPFVYNQPMRDGDFLPAKVQVQYAR